MGGDGTVWQSANEIDTRDYTHERIFYPVMGVILNVRYSDDKENRSSIQRNDQRGSQVEAEVLLLNDGMEIRRPLPNVIVLPVGASGIHNFAEQLPKPTTHMIDGSAFDPNGDPDKFDGDRCVIQFIGGMVSQPIMTHWYPHPGNTMDSATSGGAEGTEIHGVRLTKRFAGVTTEVDKLGNITVDTTQANQQITFTREGIERKSLQGGGNVQVDVRNDATLEINTNEKIPATNPPRENTRADTSTRITIDKDVIEAIAGQVVKIIAKGTNIELSPAQNLYIGDSSATENLVLGQKLKSLLETLIDLIVSHTHPTGVGPSGPTAPPESSQLVSDVKDQLEDALSDFAFTQKESPSV